MNKKDAFKWLYAIINDPQTCGGNLTENNEAFKDIIDQLGFKLVKKEDIISGDDFEPINFLCDKEGF